ncbi:MAG: alpha-D-glucose phosphate-specific phosphoglucomutase [Candidatus Schekmanbacteria bacterium]|nr:alpha-D-glucose phosphate-specific phosphoglucomutase [Candidatus Schekmanbacteria bacterium]
MSQHSLAGLPAPRELLVDVPRLVSAYYTEHPDLAEAGHRVSFGTSGHRGSSLQRTFNEDHVVAIARAVCEERAKAGVAGPLFVGRDTHALSEGAHSTVIEVLAGQEVSVVLQANGGFTPTPVISHAIIRHNQRVATPREWADGIVITPSHNPPEDGGIKYNPPSGGPADAATTARIEARANQLLEQGLGAIKRLSLPQALAAPATRQVDFASEYVEDLASVIDFEAVARAGLRVGVDPLGGAACAYWELIRNRYGIDLEVVNPVIDPTFSFMTVDHDGKIRMDCSSVHAMAGLVRMKDRFDLAFGNDPDADRHGIVTPKGGLLNPNHVLAVAVEYLFQHRPGWSREARVGKTLVSSAMIDRVAASLGRSVVEVPVGFKWFVEGLHAGRLGFAGEESAGASFLDRAGRVWATDKDGIIVNLLAAEIRAVTGRDLAALYQGLEDRFGACVYARVDAPASAAERRRLGRLSAADIGARELAGEPIDAVLTHAPGNGAAIGGVKICTRNGWFAARPSGTEAIYKIYAESFRGPAHLAAIQQEAQAIVGAALASA